MNRKNFLLMAGGTGGHIFPALAVAEKLRERGHTVVWLGSRDSMEAQLVPKHGIELETVAMKGVRGNGWQRKLVLPFTLLNTIRAARRILRKHRIDAVVGFGGFVTFPGGVAAKLAGIPLIIHEQNAVAGLSNKKLARHAAAVLSAFPQAFPRHPEGLVGNPVRADIAALPAPAQRFATRTGKLRLCVVGGSLGAQMLNEILPAALAQLPADARPHVLHQAGRGKLPALQAAYAQHGVAAECVEFIDDMTTLYRDADVLVCRAGALTIAELTAAGVGALLVPYPHAVDDHQTANARFMVAAEAGLLLPQAQLTAAALAETLAGLDRATCLRWAENARTLAMPDSAVAVADIAERAAGATS
ncbi:undecaprenyldiphospho-muramoylpentapeptide beta-N-acetylglucosaminyltransferase [Conchiformibius kuhniae]|uniref:UDP-N-acetylglucosamine--N-acetylmuramyl-(pentapeptide) pyrophosphoryl-undecaprenol N-acetylglucosamine transferase n=1 Tax=Conchiformibius kuhniae TaxID=211502 RepID=A0A8T9MTC7_9NEIS|nr:undecaprenyldiphospho-muramoylpentapeptide beta-N-acetylglucosaminyltransferase [Conchiformibius kuhniae]UOP04857.1 undecaprenyldiphospho-muramoylpentapeptide beta-N-acetylglucosaminyltransferase [Conchiformibius kuhniae]